MSTGRVAAYLRPRVSAYVARLEAPVRERRIGGLRIMTSSGGSLAPAAAATRAASLALSGPAGGVVGARLVGDAVGVADLLAIDMGGTSADASLVAGAAALMEGSGAVAGIPLALPAILIETVSAGGGSVARLDEGGALKVGPESAGAVPGPACYGRGGERPTVTDACLVLGWLDVEHPLADELRLDAPAAERAGSLAAWLAPLGERAAGELRGAAVARGPDCRFAGQGYEVTVPVADDDPARVAAAFAAAHRARFGQEGSGQPVELVNVRVAAVRGGGLPRFDGRSRTARGPSGRRAIRIGAAQVTAQVWPLDDLAAGVALAGPAVLAGADATALVEPGWRGRVHPSGAVLLERA